MKVDNGTTNFAVYEDATEFYGMAEATLPEISQITEEVKGAGIAGAFDERGLGAVVNSSRAVLTAWKKEGCDERDFAGAARREALRMKEDLAAVNKAIHI